VVGDEVWDPQSVVRLRLGPLPLARYREFLPSGSAYRPLRAMTRFFSGHDLDFEVQLILDRSETPPLCLGAEEAEAPQLGWVSWVKSREMNRDPDDTVLRLWEEGRTS
jgi:type VI secretion system protein ImpH